MHHITAHFGVDIDSVRAEDERIVPPTAHPRTAFRGCGCPAGYRVGNLDGGYTRTRSARLFPVHLLACLRSNVGICLAMRGGEVVPLWYRFTCAPDPVVPPPVPARQLLNRAIQHRSAAGPDGARRRCGLPSPCVRRQGLSAPFVPSAPVPCS